MSAQTEAAQAIADATPPIEMPAANVIVALSRVMRDLPGIAKDQNSDAGYKYRGIEQITAEAQRLFARHCVVFVPEILSRDEIELTINGRPWTEQRVTIQYRVYGPGGVDDQIVVGPLYAQGRDNSDKGTNKSLTQAYKYALLQVLCIGDSKDDADAGVAHEADAAPVIDPIMQARSDMTARIKGHGQEARDELRAWMDAEGIPRAQGKWSEVHLDAIGDRLDAIENGTGPVAADETSAPDAHETGSDAATGESGANPAAVCACGQVAVRVFDGEPLCGDHAPAEDAP